MAFKQVSELNADTTVSLGGTNRKTGKQNPTTVEGYYLGKKTIDDKKKKSGKSYLYILLTEKGNVGVWGKTDMDRKMSSVDPGPMVKITHSGMKKTPNGEMYTYKVEYDPENTTDVSQFASESSGNTEEPNYGTGADDDQEYAGTNYEAEEQESYVSQRSAPAQSQGNAEERRAKVQALLSKGKK